jgi:membrane-associated protease RseP (regulator of RpoE activity)
MLADMSTNGDGHFPIDVISEPQPPAPGPGWPRKVWARQGAANSARIYALPQKRGRSLAIAIFLFACTVVSTLTVGAQMSLAYLRGQTPSLDDFFQSYFQILRSPHALAAGIPFAATLLGILLAHELGHFFCCRYYGMAASYPYFIPAPTLIGTLGAFIRIRSPIANRKALFDVGLAGPVAGFVCIIPALVYAVLHSRIVPGVEASSQIVFGEPLLLRILLALLRPGVAARDLLLHPVGRAAWVGLFATSLNLLPAGQLDGGHMLYSLADHAHRRATIGVALALLPLAYFWLGWIAWAAILLLLGFRHPPLVDRHAVLDNKRRVWAAIGLAIFVLSFLPVPVIVNG